MRLGSRVAMFSWKGSADNSVLLCFLKLSFSHSFEYCLNLIFLFFWKADITFHSVWEVKRSQWKDWARRTSSLWHFSLSLSHTHTHFLQHFNFFSCNGGDIFKETIIVEMKIELDDFRLHIYLPIPIILFCLSKIECNRTTIYMKT